MSFLFSRAEWLGGGRSVSLDGEGGGPKDPDRHRFCVGLKNDIREAYLWMSAAELDRVHRMIGAALDTARNDGISWPDVTESARGSSEPGDER